MRGAAAEPGHLGRGRRLVDEDQAQGIEVRLGVEPGLAARDDVGPLLLAGVCLFLKVTPDCRVRVPPHQVDVVDATGAGDTLCGAVLARILAGDGPEPAARHAVLAAALACTGYGAVAPIPTAAQVHEATR
jgi:sugar/nucleoside kinase (ribokinase family)